MTNEITENVKDFILGGKADFTIFQEKTANTKAVKTVTGNLMLGM